MPEVAEKATYINEQLIADCLSPHAKPEVAEVRAILQA